MKDDIIQKIEEWKTEMTRHLTKELLPFWTSCCWDGEWGGFITQFGADGEDTGVDEKSLLAHMRTIYSLSLAAQHGHDPDGICRSLAAKGVQHALDYYWDNVHGGFYWLFDRRNRVIIDKKILYGHSFAIYALATYSKVFGDPRGLQYAEACFDLLQKYGAETVYGGYLEMFERNWQLCSPDSGGGDRKTLDVHMHLMEAFTALYACSGKDIHKRKLEEIIEILMVKILHPKFRTGIPQFYRTWEVAPQIKFEVVWGWDRFTDGDSVKQNAFDNTSYGHNVEFFWLLLEALSVLNADPQPYRGTFDAILDHALTNGVDWQHGGVYVEGSHEGGKVYDDTKEFWQQAEFLTGMLDAYLLYNDKKYLTVYENVHRFVMDKMINHQIGEWLPLLERDGTPVWKHMSHSWKVNYHSIRAAVLSIHRLNKVLNRINLKS
ncbi:AGE family epimerase/isomerase [Marispirochaeta sp.]|jgi:mannose/cellobiose epimerase-like protein (N-acyl-D-glucosamine 2-epimerase family)|uniref:AGE family epimerase/isomerase n=1 Tax=Marispirochaeta sp. TaxID=2038653 RepID=UPI0029C7857E|nr:AGE family epimerase/isomerase [Marispirochaeta sp.]